MCWHILAKNVKLVWWNSPTLGKKNLHVKLVWRNSPELVINLRTHLLIHNGEQSFTCKSCLKKFNHTFSLKTHLVTHTGDKPEACLKKFSQAAHLRRHQMTHLGEKLLDNKFTFYLVVFFSQLPTSISLKR